MLGRRGRTLRGVASAVALTLVAGLVVVGGVVGWRVWHGAGSPFAADEECSATVGGHVATLDPEQARWAGLIVATSVARGMPAQAASIALATAYQESKLYNLRYGDRDSVGLFQQRPSQGWGTREQLLDPVYAIEAFYDALARVDGYLTMPITEAAQEVQRSGFPTAYADHEPDARALASALSGHSAHAFSCRLATPDGRGAVRAVRGDLDSVFPGTSLSASGRDLTVAAPDPTRGWALAQYLVSQAHRLRLAWVAYGGHTWRAGDGSGNGWQPGASGNGRVRAAVAA